MWEGGKGKERIDELLARIEREDLLAKSFGSLMLEVWQEFLELKWLKENPQQNRQTLSKYTMKYGIDRIRNGAIVENIEYSDGAQARKHYKENVKDEDILGDEFQLEHVWNDGGNGITCWLFHSYSKWDLSISGT